MTATVSSSHTDVAFVTAQIGLVGNRGKLLGGKGDPKAESGTLYAPRTGLVLWRVIERASVEKRLTGREITPASDGQSVAYSYRVEGGDGGLLPIEEPGQFKAELVAVFANPSFLPEVGKVEIVTADIGDTEAGEGKRAIIGRKTVASAAQLEGRLIRLPGDIADHVPIVWFVEHSARHALESPICGRLRFGDGWQRLVQPLPTVEDLAIVPDGAPLTVAECSNGKLVASWPDPRAYLVEQGKKRQIISDALIIERFGEHWRIRIVDLRPADLALIPEGDAIR